MAVKYKEVKTINEFIDAVLLRYDVFVREQGFKPGWEPDEEDKVSRQFIAVSDGKVVATARYRESPKGQIKIERVAVKRQQRKRGIGEGLLRFMVARIRKLELGRIWLRSQLEQQPFYEKCGFTSVYKPYDKYGVPHIDMEYSK